MADKSPASTRCGAVDPRWPERAQRLAGEVAAICDDWLREPLRACLMDFDRRLPEHIGGQGNAVDQQSCENTRRRLVQVGDTFATRFIDHLHAGFVQLGVVSTAPERSTSFGALSLSLLDPLDQALDTELDQIVQRGELRGGPVLVAIGYRLAVLIAAPPLEGVALPLAPRALMGAFRAASSPLEIPATQQLALAQSLDATVIQPVSTLYASVNAYLQREGILPRLRVFSVPRPPRRKARPPGTQQADTQPAPVPASALLASRAATPASAPATPNTTSSAHSAPALSSRSILVHGVAGASVGRAPPATVSDAELGAALDAMQWTLTDAAHDGGGAAGWRRLHAALVRQINVANVAGATAAGDARLSASQARAMAQVVRWFREARSQLPRNETIGTLLDDLQWPLLRVVLSHPDSATQPGHPAYRLLRKVVEVARDWLPCGVHGELDALVRSQLDQSLAPIVHEMPDLATCAVVCAEIERNLDQWRNKARVAERRHVEAMRGRERLERARQRAAVLLAARLVTVQAPDPLRALFDDAWADVLALALLRRGESSGLFTTLLAVTDQMLGRVPVDDPQRLRQEVEAGLQQIGLYGNEAIRMAGALIDTSAASRHGRVDTSEESELSSAHQPHVSEPEPGASFAGAGFAGFVPGSPQDVVLQHLREARFGGWYEFADTDDGAPRQRRLAGFSALSGRCLFVTRRGQRVSGMDLRRLADAIVDGTVRELRTEVDDEPSM